MKHYFIVNPAAGNGQSLEGLMERIEATCRDARVDFEIYITKAVGDATDFVRRTCRAWEKTPTSDETALRGVPPDSKDADTLRFYSCGGDGTNNEVVAGAMGCNYAAVGFIPIGTGNDFIRCFTHEENFSDVGAQLNSYSEMVDLIACGDRYIVNIMNMGFDCEVVRRTASLKRLPLISPSFAYILGVVGELIRKTGTRLKVSMDGGEWLEKRLLLATFANGRYYGGGFRAAPRARLQDGMFDVCFVKNISRRKFVSLVKYYRSGTYLDQSQFKNIVEYFRCRTLELQFEKPQSVCMDGEISEQTTLRLEILPQKLRILVPKGSAFAENEAERVSFAPEAALC